MKIAASAFAVMWAATLPAYADPHSGWQAIAAAPAPAVGYDAGPQGRVVIRCDNNRGLHTYVLAISGPAAGLKNSAWTYVKVAGERVMMAVEVDSGGTATLTAASSTSRYAENEAPGNRDVYDAIVAMKRASAIRIDSGDFHINIPAAGLETALTEATATCGDPKKLAEQVKARSEPM